MTQPIDNLAAAKHELSMCHEEIDNIKTRLISLSDQLNDIEKGLDSAPADYDPSRADYIAVGIIQLRDAHRRDDIRSAEQQIQPLSDYVRNTITDLQC